MGVEIEVKGGTAVAVREIAGRVRETGSAVGVQAAIINSQTIKTIGIFCFTIRSFFMVNGLAG
jgi:hypothetical protein